MKEMSSIECSKYNVLAKPLDPFRSKLSNDGLNTIVLECFFKKYFLSLDMVSFLSYIFVFVTEVYVSYKYCECCTWTDKVALGDFWVRLYICIARLVTLEPLLILALHFCSLFILCVLLCVIVSWYVIM